MINDSLLGLAEFLLDEVLQSQPKSIKLILDTLINIVDATVDCGLDIILPDIQLLFHATVLFVNLLT